MGMGLRCRWYEEDRQFFICITGINLFWNYFKVFG
jgi:hypothetical protein